MSIALSIALFFVIWWTLLFLVLPFGVRTQEEDGAIVPGTPESAPTRPRLFKIALWNTLLSAVVFAIIWAVIVYNLLPFEIVPQTMPRSVP